MTEENPKNPSYSLEIYKEINNNLRHYSNVSLTLLSVFFALNAGLCIIAFNSKISSGSPESIAIKILGIVISFFFLLQEMSALFIWTRLVQQAYSIESNLKIKQYQHIFDLYHDDKYEVENTSLNRIKNLKRTSQFGKIWKITTKDRPATLAIYLILISSCLFWFLVLLFSDVKVIISN